MFEQRQAERVERRAPRWLVWVIWPGSLLIAFVLGTLGTYEHLSTHPSFAELSWLTLLGESILTGIGFLVMNSGPFPSDSPTGLPLVFVGRFFGIVFVFSTAFIAVSHLFTRRVQLLEIELTHTLSAAFSNPAAARHTLICGLTDESVELAKQLLSQGERVVVLAEDSNPTNVRDVRRAGAWVFHGSLDNPDTLKKHGKIRLADEVFVASENEPEAVSIVHCLYEVVDDLQTRSPSSTGRPIRCYLNLSPSGTRRYLHEQVGTGSGFRTRLGEQDVLELYTYDEPTATARELLKRHPPDFESSSSEDSIHVLLIGWSSYTRSIVIQLCHLLHLGDGSRRVTIATENPEQRQKELVSEFPCLDSSNFPADGQREFLSSLFPEIDFVDLPAQPERLLADNSELTDRFESDQRLTVVFGENRGLETGFKVAGIIPRLDEFSSELEMDTEVLYYEGDHRELSIKDGIDTEALERTTLTSFTQYYDGLTPSAIRGTRRDQVAKQVALFYFLKYDYEDDETPTYLNERTSELLTDANSSDIDASSVWNEFTPSQRSVLADLHWNALSEHYRNANRHAADHAPFKRRLVKRLSEENSGLTDLSQDGAVHNSDVVEYIAEIEHRRWCAEKLLNGWEPLPKHRWSEWKDERQQKLRERRYHRDLWPIDDLNEQTETAFEKDIDQVRFVLNLLKTGTKGR